MSAAPKRGEIIADQISYMFSYSQRAPVWRLLAGSFSARGLGGRLGLQVGLTDLAILGIGSSDGKDRLIVRSSSQEGQAMQNLQGSHSVDEPTIDVRSPCDESDHVSDHVFAFLRLRIPTFQLPTMK